MCAKLSNNLTDHNVDLHEEHVFSALESLVLSEFYTRLINFMSMSHAKKLEGMLIKL